MVFRKFNYICNFIKKLLRQITDRATVHFFVRSGAEGEGRQEERRNGKNQI
jgi:hypothetical protein